MWTLWRDPSPITRWKDRGCSLQLLGMRLFKLWVSVTQRAKEEYQSLSHPYCRKNKTGFLRVKVIAMNSVRDYWKSQDRKGKANQRRRLSSKAALRSVPLYHKEHCQGPSTLDTRARSGLLCIPLPAVCSSTWRFANSCDPQNLPKTRTSRHMHTKLLPTATGQLVGSRLRATTAFRVPKTERTQLKFFGE